MNSNRHPEEAGARPQRSLPDGHDENDAAPQHHMADPFAHAYANEVHPPSYEEAQASTTGCAGDQKTVFPSVRASSSSPGNHAASSQETYVDHISTMTTKQNFSLFFNNNKKTGGSLTNVHWTPITLTSLARLQNLQLKRRQSEQHFERHKTSQCRSPLRRREHARLSLVSGHFRVCIQRPG